MEFDFVAKKLKELNDLHDKLKAERSKCDGRFERVRKFVNLTSHDPDEKTTENTGSIINDSTAFNSMVKSGRSLVGILWNGKGTFKLSPLDKYKESQSPDAEFDEDLLQFYEDATDIIAEQMDMAEAGLSKALERYGNDFQAVGNGGIGVSINSGYVIGNEDNALQFKFYGVDSCNIGVGETDTVEYITREFDWPISRLIRTFAYEDGELQEELFELLPAAWKKDWEARELTNTHKFVYVMQPNAEFKRGVKGKKGCKYVGYYCDYEFKSMFHVEYYVKRPINFVRDILINDETYAHAQGTIMLPTIEMLNFVMGTTIENIEKLTDPALGVVDGVLSHDNIIDTSAGGVTPINASQDGGAPFMPLQTVGDISGVINVLVPMLREQIIEAFDVNLLSDLNSAKQQTAQEFLGRMKLRAEGLRNRLKTNIEGLLLPLIDASSYLCVVTGAINKNEIPEAIYEDMRAGKRWYNITFLNDLGRLTNVDLVDGINTLLMVLSQLAQINPMLVHKIHGEDILEKVNEYLANDETFLVGKRKYKQVTDAIAQQNAKQIEMQNANLAADSFNKVAKADIGGGNEQVAS